jgi:hypothetical protein
MIYYILQKPPNFLGYTNLFREVHFRSIVLKTKGGHTSHATLIVAAENNRSGDGHYREIKCVKISSHQNVNSTFNEACRCESSIAVEDRTTTPKASTFLTKLIQCSPFMYLYCLHVVSRIVICIFTLPFYSLYPVSRTNSELHVKVVNCTVFLSSVTIGILHTSLHRLTHSSQTHFKVSTFILLYKCTVIWV